MLYDIAVSSWPRLDTKFKAKQLRNGYLLTKHEHYMAPLKLINTKRALLQNSNPLTELRRVQLLIYHLFDLHPQRQLPVLRHLFEVRIKTHQKLIVVVIYVEGAIPRLQVLYGVQFRIGIGRRRGFQLVAPSLRGFKGRCGGQKGVSAPGLVLADGVAFFERTAARRGGFGDFLHELHLFVVRPSRVPLCVHLFLLSDDFAVGVAEVLPAGFDCRFWKGEIEWTQAYLELCLQPNIQYFMKMKVMLEQFGM